MIKLIDNFLNKITMYRLVLYYLIFLLIIAVFFCFIGVIPYTPADLIFSAVFITAVCWITNFIFARVFKTYTNIESVYITALILTFILAPLNGTDYYSYFPLAIWASVWAMASKYILAIKKKHLFNPAAFAVALTAVTINQSANWWVGNLYMMPFVIVGGLLMTRKLIRFDLVLSFLIVSFAAILVTTYFQGANVITIAWKALSETPIFFFAFVMLTEPLTTPPTRILRVCYGVLVGFLFAPAIHIGSIYSTPELTLIAGNVFSYLVSPKRKLILQLTGITKLTPDTYDFSFRPDEKLSFKPGKYMEWTLGHKYPDNRGNRRYFTIASSPTEENIRLGVKFYGESSTFKIRMASMKAGDKIVASQIAGDFVMPRKKEKKLVFIAGGIGITPFRSMIKYLLDKNEERDIVLFYSNRTEADIAYKEIFDEAQGKLGIKTVYTLTEAQLISPSWQGQKGFINEQVIKQWVPDYQERTFYISGPRSMVVAFKETLKNMGVKKRHIKTDFFPGFV